jgi:transcriptional regulator GlxA family with amidase domain
MDDHIPDRIEALGDRRSQGLAIADAALNDIVDLLPVALAAGMTKDEVAELAGVSRQTLDGVARRRRKDPEFHERMRKQLDDIKGVLDQLSSSSPSKPAA